VACGSYVLPLYGLREAGLAVVRTRRRTAGFSKWLALVAMFFGVAGGIATGILTDPATLSQRALAGLPVFVSTAAVAVALLSSVPASEQRLRLPWRRPHPPGSRPTEDSTQ
jgi:ABC-type transport system involved in cytochrome c biogenesis permease subunit